MDNYVLKHIKPTRAVLGGKSTALSAYFREEESCKLLI